MKLKCLYHKSNGSLIVGWGRSNLTAFHNSRFTLDFRSELAHGDCLKKKNVSVKYKFCICYYFLSTLFCLLSFSFFVFLSRSSASLLLLASMEGPGRIMSCFVLFFANKLVEQINRLRVGEIWKIFSNN